MSQRTNTESATLPATAAERRQLLAALLKTEGADRKPFALLEAADRARLPAGIEDAYPLTLLQRGMIYHQESAPESTVYHDLFRYQIGSRLDPSAFAATAAELVARHSVLRTRFDLGGFSEPMQLVEAAVEPELEVRDLSALPPKEQAAELERLATAEQHRRLDVTRAPLLRCITCRLGEGSFELVLSFHHAILDGWSVALLVQELLDDYSARLSGRPAGAAPAPPLTFRDYVALERRALTSDPTREFWRGAVAELERTELPRRLGNEPGAGVESLSVPLPEELGSRLDAVAAKLGVGLKSVLLAVYARVLGAVCGERRVALGVVTNGRPEEEGGDRLLGLFLNTLPFRLDLAPGSWAELVRATFAAEAAWLPHRRFPLAEIQRLSGGAALFEAAFNFIHFHAYGGAREGDAAILGTEVRESTNFTLLANFSRSPVRGSAGIHLDLAYDAALLEGAQVARVGEACALALAALCRDPEAPHHHTRLLSAADFAATAGTWVERAARPVHPETLVARFARSVAAHGGRTAVSRGERRFTYAELNAAANRVAHCLRARGVGPEVRVGLCLGRDLELLAALLGILKAGGAYVPLDPDYPRERLALMVEDAGIELVVTEEALRDRLPAGVGVLSLDAEAAVIAAAPATDPAVSISPEHLAYVIYTSGSTGKPKGVMVTHANVERLMSQTEPWFGFGPEEVWTLFHSVAFDFSVWEIWGALTYGGRLVVVPLEMRRTPDAFYELLAAEGVTVLNQTPSAFTQLIAAEGWLAGKGLTLSLSWVIFGGEALELQSLRPWFERHGDSSPTLVNMYGITETTVHVTFRPIRAADLEGGRGSVIGGPIPDLAALVLDRAGEPAPIGAPGELCVAGLGVARGYLGRPALTAARFAPDAFGSSGGRLYHSGDLARFRPDGELEYLGRIDFQVKVRGFRIELGEIEAALARNRGVSAAVVVLRQDAARQDQRLVAYVARQADAELAAEGLRTALAAELPEHMVPAAIVLLDKLPLTGNGKVDRKALPEPSEGDEHASSKPYRAPRTEVEEKLAALWAEVLRRETVGIDDGFFEVGGHSLLATQLIVRIRQTFELDIPLRSLIAAESLAELAAEIEGMRAAAEEAALAALLADVESLSDDEAQALLAGGGEVAR